MPPMQNQLVTQLVEAYGYKEAMKVLAKKAGYKDVPPSFHEFITNTDYLGGTVDLYPTWVQSLHDIYPNEFGSPYLEIGLTGAIGLGKTTASKVGMCYDMCRLMFLNCPQSFYGVAPDTKIVFALINANLALAQGVLKDGLDEWMQTSAFFAELRKKAAGKSYLPNRIHVVVGSRPSHALGMAVAGAILSELNFQSAIADQAYENYSNIIIRLKSRFQGARHKHGHYPGRIWLDSSKNDVNSFMEDHITKNVSDPELRVFDYPYWEVHKHKGMYSGKTFKVFVGDQTRDPFIVERADQTINLPEAYLVDVPVEHEKAFRTDLRRALKDIAGKGTWSSSKLISSGELIERTCSLENPIYREIITAQFADRSQKLYDYIKREGWVKLGLDSRPRFIHLDLGLKKDHTGIACTSINGYQKQERFNPRTGKVDTYKEPKYVTEWVMAIEPAPGDEVPIYKIKELIIMLASNGVNIGMVTADGYQSANILQDLREAGFETDVISLDRKKDNYEAFRDSMAEGRWLGPNHPLLKEELRDLADTGRKYDHSHDGSKDLADAVAGSLANARKNMDKHHKQEQFDNMTEILDRLESEEENIYNMIANRF